MVNQAPYDSKIPTLSERVPVPSDHRERWISLESDKDSCPACPDLVGKVSTFPEKISLPPSQAPAHRWAPEQINRAALRGELSPRAAAGAPQLPGIPQRLWGFPASLRSASSFAPQPFHARARPSACVQGLCGASLRKVRAQCGQRWPESLRVCCHADRSPCHRSSKERPRGRNPQRRATAHGYLLDRRRHVRPT